MNAPAADQADRATPVRRPVLVVGVGSELRSDDAAGRRVAEHIATTVPPDAVEIRSVHQLTPELADAMTGRRLVVVVDASVDVDEVCVDRVAARNVTAAMTHHVDVVALVGLARVLGAPPDEVVTVALPARNLGLGMSLSPATAHDVRTAAALVTLLCFDRLRRPAASEGRIAARGTGITAGTGRASRRVDVALDPNIARWSGGPARPR